MEGYSLEAGETRDSPEAYNPARQPFGPAGPESCEPEDPTQEPFRPIEPSGPEPSGPYYSRFLPAEIESPVTSESGASQALESSAFLGDTEIRGFESSGVLGNREVAEFMHDSIPLTHAEGIRSIEFDPANEVFTEDKQVRAVYQDGEIVMGPAGRTVFPEGGEGAYVAPGEGVLWTLSHEIGHGVFEHKIASNDDLFTNWLALHEQSWDQFQADGSGFPTAYSRQDMVEDFAESYMAYMHDPERLQFYSPDKYEYMRDEVFAGNEYPRGAAFFSLTDIELVGTEGAERKMTPEEAFESVYELHKAWYASPYTDGEIESLVRASASMDQVAGHYDALRARQEMGRLPAERINWEMRMAVSAGYQWAAPPEQVAMWRGELAAIQDGSKAITKQMETIRAKFPQISAL